MTIPLLAPVLLDRPPRGHGVVVHDATFQAWDRSFSFMRDVVNLGVDALNQAGASLRHLPHGSLEELLVLPLCGDYGAIRQNARACRDVSSAWSGWSRQVALLGAGVAVAWHGASSTAYVARIEAVAAGAAATAVVLERGARVLTSIATAAERFGVRVERLVVDLGRTLSRVVRRLLTRIGGPGGWALFAAELLTQGLSAVSDLVDDVRRVVRLVDDLLELKEQIVDWAHDQRDALDFLLDLRLGHR
ncbi:MAG: hypothetical protein LH468_13100 [Nocardioides sp.]|nr:hypothetical protein [Nocardioides sp.]